MQDEGRKFEGLVRLKGLEPPLPLRGPGPWTFRTLTITLPYTGRAMTRADLHRLIDDLPDEAVEGASVLIQRVLLRDIDPSQAWVWTPEWQNQLRRSLSDLASGRTRRFESGETFHQSLL